MDINSTPSAKLATWVIFETLLPDPKFLPIDSDVLREPYLAQLPQFPQLVGICTPAPDRFAHNPTPATVQ